MTEPSTRFTQLGPMTDTRTKIITVFGLFIIGIHLLLMIMLVVNVVGFAPEIKTTLQDVKILVPQMHKTISELGTLLPEITQGMRILKQLCLDNNNCQLG